MDKKQKISSKKDEIVFDDEMDIEEPENLSHAKKIYTEQGDPEIDSLHGRFKRGKLNIQWINHLL